MIFPLLAPRGGDTCFEPPVSPVHELLLEVPRSQAGRVRLQLEFPWREETGSSAFVVEWPRRARLPASTVLATTVWAALRRRGPWSRTRRAGLVQRAVHHSPWSGRIYVRSQDTGTTANVDPGLWTQWLAAAFDYAASMLVPTRRWSTADPQRWIYGMHQQFALLVADGLAREYLKAPSLPNFKELRAAEATLRGDVRRVWPAGRLTPRRLALALVDAKFKDLRPRLLRTTRCVGLDDGRLWSRVLLPGRAARLRTLCANDEYAGRWTRRWRSLMCSSPTTPYKFFCAPGEEDLAARIWRAIYS